MINYSNEEDDHNCNYSPNEPAKLSTGNPKEYRQIVQSNLSEGDSIEAWQQRNINRAKAVLGNKPYISNNNFY